MTQRIAIIGAGLSGLACAQQLQSRGVHVELFEKSRGPSGRMSTRRADGWQCDHGAQYFTARDPAFQAEVAAWVEAGVAAEWTPRLTVFGPRPPADPGGAPRRWVGTPRMTSPAGHLARALTVHLEHTVHQLERVSGGWQVHTREQGAVGAPFNAVVCAVPAQQAAVLLEGPAPALAGVAREARMRGAFALMVRYAEPLPVSFDAAFVNQGPLRWVARDSSKPGRPAGETWALQTEATWSEAHLEFAPELVAGQVLEAWGGWLRGAGLAAAPTPEWTLHRWRYADLEQPLQRGAVWSAELALGLCGDWLGSGRVEGAWLSGRALAEAIVS